MFGKFPDDALQLENNRLVLPITVDNKGKLIEVTPKVKAGYLNGADPEYIECFAANFITFWEQESTGFSG
jgi:hypothetical protein